MKEMLQTQMSIHTDFRKKQDVEKKRIRDEFLPAIRVLEANQEDDEAIAAGKKGGKSH